MAGSRRSLHTKGHANEQQPKGHASGGGLSQKEEELVEQLRAAVADSIKDSKPLQHFVSTMTLIRYLKARSWHLQRATKMLQATLAWRREYKPEAITWEDIVPEAETGKQFLLPDQASGGVAVDRAGRPVLVLRPRNENTKTWDRQMRFVIYNLEVTSWIIDQAGGSEEAVRDGTLNTGMSWLVDFVGYTYSTAPPIKSALHTLHVLQNHYPERLGTAIAYLPPRIFSLMWRGIYPFMDADMVFLIRWRAMIAATKEKITFIDNEKKAAGALGALLDLKNVEKCMAGGQSDYVYNLEKYSQLRNASDEIRQREFGL